MLISSSEIYVPLKQPLLPMKLLKIRSFNVVVIVGTVGQMVYYALNVLWPTQIATLYTTDNITIGWMSVSHYSSPFGKICYQGTDVNLLLQVHDWSGLSDRRTHGGSLFQSIWSPEIATRDCDLRIEHFPRHHGHHHATHTSTGYLCK